MPLHADLFKHLRDGLPYFRGIHAEVLRSESYVLLDRGSDDLVVRVLMHHADAPLQPVRLIVRHVLRYILAEHDHLTVYLPVLARQDHIQKLCER